MEIKQKVWFNKMKNNILAMARMCEYIAQNINILAMARMWSLKALSAYYMGLSIGSLEKF